MKRNRKTKLVPRDCGENEENKNMRMEELTKSLLSELETEDRELDSLPNTLQTMLPKLRTELDKTYEDNTESSNRELKFSIDIEVEECEDDDVTETHENITSQSDDSDVELVIDEEKNSQEQKWPVFVTDKEFRDSVEKLSKMTRALADKISEIHIRNYLGRCVNEGPDETDHYTRCIQEVFPQVMYWQKLSKFREGILCYKCYVCDIGWWHMGPFRDHVRDHSEEIRLSFEATSNEGCIVAHFDPLTSVKEIPIEGRCWQCMKPWVEHVNLKRTTGLHYNCSSCNFKTPTCLALLEHEGFCMRYHKDNIKETISYEVPCKCQICSINCITEERLNTHMTLSHFARSDFHCNPANLRRCQSCNLSYVIYNSHNCPNRTLNVICDYCMRRFRGRFLAEVHMTNTKKNVRCAICNIYLRSQCMESQHVVKHSKHYVALYKCVICPNHLFFNNERTMREHKAEQHQDRKRNFYFEIVIAPRTLFPRLPYCEVEMIPPVKPYILGPKLEPIPKKELSATGTSIGETEKAVDALRQDYHDVNGHDYLLHTYNTVTELQNIPSPKDDSQLQIADDTMAAIASISDATIKTEAEDYEDYDQTEMDIVYEEVDIKKEEFLDTMSNAFVSIEDATDTMDNQDYSNVFKVSNPIVTVIKEEIPLNYDAAKSEEEPTPEKNEMEVVKNSEKMDVKEHLSDDDIEDDIIVLNDESKDNYTQIHDNDIDDVSIVNSVNETINISDKIDDNDIDEVSIVNSVNETSDKINDNDIDDVSIVNNVNEIIDISDSEMESDVDDSIKSSKQSSETIKENDESVVINKRVKCKIYKCPKCDFKAPHKEFKNHIETKCHRSIRNSTGGKAKTLEPWPSYPCSKCNFIYPDFKTYISHLRCHKVPRETCPECLEIFRKPLQLMNHLKGHVKRMFTKIYVILENVNLQVITSMRDNVYKCKICSQVVKYRKFFKHWESHLKFETKREDTMECKIERKGEDKAGQLDHMKLSPDQLKMLLDLIRSEKPRVDPVSAMHPCVLCWRPFTRAAYLKVHYIEHLLGNAMYKRLMLHTESIACQICNEEFNHNSTYKQHMRNHANMPVYRCELCSHSFSDSSNFAKHKKVHNMGAMVCDVCGAKFFKKDSLVKHMQIHQKADPMKCELCLKEFCSPKLYKKHVRVAHKGKASFTCNICLEKLTSSKDRLDHMWTAHQYRKKKIDCPVCKRSFRKFMDMKNHIRLTHCTDLKLKSKQFSRASETDLANSLTGKGWAKGGGSEAKIKDFACKSNDEIKKKDEGAKVDNLSTKLEKQVRVYVKKCKVESEIKKKDEGAKVDNLSTKLEKEVRVYVKKYKVESVENTKEQAKSSEE